ncbi:1035_t:CDS:2, partial [Gigaspora margarita]
RLYNVDHTQISKWQVKEKKFKNAKKTSCRVGSGALSLYSLAKNLLKEWIVEQHLKEIAVTPNNVKFRMTNLLSNEFKLSYPNALNTFKASDLWLNLFMNQFDLSLRRRTKTSQKLPKNLSEKLVIGAYTLDNCANRSKLSPIVIFKDKRVPKVEAVWKQRPGGQNKRSLLVFDLFEGHLTTIVKNKCYDMNTVLGVISGGLISVVQPLDIKNHLIESNQTEKKEECVIDLVDKNKENKKVLQQLV